MNHFLILYLVVLPCRGSTSSRYGPLDPLPGGCVSFSHHRDRLPDEAHLDDNDGCLQVRQDQEAHHLPQPQLHGPAAGVRGGPQQRDNATDPYAKADRCGDTCLNRLALASRWFFFVPSSFSFRRPAPRACVWSAGSHCVLSLLVLLLLPHPHVSLGVPTLPVGGGEMYAKKSQLFGPGQSPVAGRRRDAL